MSENNQKGVVELLASVWQVVLGEYSSEKREGAGKILEGRLREFVRAAAHGRWGREDVKEKLEGFLKGNYKDLKDANLSLMGPLLQSGLEVRFLTELAASVRIMRQPELAEKAESLMSPGLQETSCESVEEEQQRALELAKAMAKDPANFRSHKNRLKRLSVRLRDARSSPDVVVALAGFLKHAGGGVKKVVLGMLPDLDKRGWQGFRRLLARVLLYAEALDLNPTLGLEPQVNKEGQ